MILCARQLHLLKETVLRCHKVGLGQSTKTRDIKWVSGKEGVNILSNAKVSQASGESSPNCQGSKMLSLCWVSSGFSTRTHSAQTVCGITGQQVSLRQISPYISIAQMLKWNLTTHRFHPSYTSGFCCCCCCCSKSKDIFSMWTFLFIKH